MTQDVLDKGLEMQREIAQRMAQLDKCKKAFEQLSVSNENARTFITISNPGNSTSSIKVDRQLYPEAEFILEYIKRLETYIANLNAEFEAL
jgi:hypothetical protein